MKHLLADAINRMPDRERLVLTLYYYEGLTLAEIGDVLGVTESRVCQIHTKAILQLRCRLAESTSGPVRSNVPVLALGPPGGRLSARPHGSPSGKRPVACRSHALPVSCRLLHRGGP